MLLAIAHGVVEILGGHDCQHRSEDLLLGDAHLLVDIGEDGRLDEVALVVGAARQPIAADLRLAAFFAADVDVLEVGLELALINGRTDVDARLHAVADLQLLRALNQRLDELVVDRVLDDGAAGRRALLSGREERRVDGVFDGGVEVASASTMVGFLPPISSWMRSRRLEACSCSQLPTSQDPVNEMAFSGLALTSASPIAPPEPATKLTTPFGMPASWQASMMRHALSGATDAGLMITVLPQIERRSELPRRDGAREVPGRDQTDDAERLAEREHVDAVAFARHDACRTSASLRRAK